MSVTRLIKPEKLLEYFDKEVKAILLKNQLYSIDAYGWKDAETVCEEYDGLAKWDIDPIVDFDFEAYWDNKPFSEEPTEKNINLMALGYDFFEVMKSAWLSLGQALFFKESENDDLSLEFTYATNSLISAISQLNIASDRIRDFYILSTINITFEKYNREKGQSKSYDSFFKAANIRIKGNFMANPIVRAKISLAQKLATKEIERRRYRNRLIHQLASNNAVIQKALLKEQRDLFRLQASPSKVMNNKKKLSKPQQIEDYFDDVKLRYIDLVDLGNCVFQIEQWIREQLIKEQRK